jgi:hypothetical protein
MAFTKKIIVRVFIGSLVWLYFLLPVILFFLLVESEFQKLFLVELPLTIFLFLLWFGGYFAASITYLLIIVLIWYLVDFFIKQVYPED